jgi:hypothetical protein
VFKCVHGVGGVVLFFCIKFNWNFTMVKNLIYLFENVGGGNEFAPNLSIVLFCKLSNVKSVHQQCDNDL